MSYMITEVCLNAFLIRRIGLIEETHSITEHA